VTYKYIDKCVIIFSVTGIITGCSHGNVERCFLDLFYISRGGNNYNVLLLLKKKFHPILITVIFTYISIINYTNKTKNEFLNFLCKYSELE